MKKISAKFVALALTLLTFFVAGGIGIRSVIAPNGGSIGPSDPGTGGGG
ncbi:MAG: hypothetical protein ACTSSH_10530 [Candidatus Heimdallarchaeota archaeon]